MNGFANIMCKHMCYGRFPRSFYRPVEMCPEKSMFARGGYHGVTDKEEELAKRCLFNGYQGSVSMLSVWVCWKGKAVFEQILSRK